MANVLLNGPKTTKSPKKVGRPRKAPVKKVAPPKAHKVIIDVKKDETPKNGLLTSGIPTWAYKKGEKAVVLRTIEEIERYVEHGWSDNPMDAK